MKRYIEIRSSSFRPRSVCLSLAFAMCRSPPRDSVAGQRRRATDQKCLGVRPDERSSKDVTEMFRRQGGYLLHAVFLARLLLDRGDPTVLDPTGNDPFEHRQIGRDVEGEAVHRDPTRDLDPDGADLVVADPDTGVVLLVPNG